MKGSLLPLLRPLLRTIWLTLQHFAGSHHTSDNPGFNFPLLLHTSDTYRLAPQMFLTKRVQNLYIHVWIFCLKSSYLQIEGIMSKLTLKYTWSAWSLKFQSFWQMFGLSLVLLVHLSIPWLIWISQPIESESWNRGPSQVRKLHYIRNVKVLFINLIQKLTLLLIIDLFESFMIPSLCVGLYYELLDIFQLQCCRLV